MSKMTLCKQAMVGDMRDMCELRGDKWIILTFYPESGEDKQ